MVVNQLLKYRRCPRSGSSYLFLHISFLAKTTFGFILSSRGLPSIASSATESSSGKLEGHFHLYNF